MVNPSCRPQTIWVLRRLERAGPESPSSSSLTTSARSSHSPRTIGASTAPTTEKRGCTRTRRRWTSTSRCRARAGLDAVVASALQHRRPAAERPLRHGDPALRQSAPGAPIELRNGTQTRSFLPCRRHEALATTDGLAVLRPDLNVGSSERLRIVDLAERVKQATGQVRDHLHPVRPGLRAGDRGHPPPRARDREDPRCDGWTPSATSTDLADVIAERGIRSRRRPITRRCASPSLGWVVEWAARSARPAWHASVTRSSASSTNDEKNAQISAGRSPSSPGCKS